MCISKLLSFVWILKTKFFDDNNDGKVGDSIMKKWIFQISIFLPFCPHHCRNRLSSSSSHPRLLYSHSMLSNENENMFPLLDFYFSTLELIYHFYIFAFLVALGYFSDDVLSYCECIWVRDNLIPFHSSSYWHGWFVDSTLLYSLCLIHNLSIFACSPVLTGNNGEKW